MTYFRQFTYYILLPAILIIFLISLFLGYSLLVDYYDACVEAKFYNLKYEKDYSCEDFFWTDEKNKIKKELKGQHYEP